VPDLSTSMHIDMLREFKRRRALPVRLFRAIKQELFSPPIYGMEWGDPDTVQPLQFIRDRFVLPFVRDDHTALEIGPGGGRWTRYLLGFGKLYVVDFYPELLAELRKNFRRPNMVFVKNNGTDFPGIEPGSVDYVFSFGTFVHLDPEIIEAYLVNLRPIVRPGSNVVIQYSDKTKTMAEVNPGFADTTPEMMRSMISRAGYRILDEDLTTLWHSSVVRFTKRAAQNAEARPIQSA
jgi:cyclopropane fatty-acyl-phospholipid synthase-like methyltransferase